VDISLKATRRQFLRATGLGAVAWMMSPLFAREVEVAGGEPLMIVRPTPQQLAWQEAELSMFLHFGMNTFTDREWGQGTEDPRLFNPANLDAGQWAQVAKEAGFKYLILTAKHHDGLCLWPSTYTEHSVKNASWRGGKGDVVRELADACRKERIKMGIYLSPWDRNAPTYGTPAYNDHFKNQLTELLTGYGEIAEVWFDGACGEGPNGKKQEYDWQGYYDVIRRLQPNALIAISGPDIRWVGNEDGYARETEWSVQDANPTLHAGREGKVWWPAECDVSIRPGWFWHKAEDDKVKSLDQLMDIYFKSVGRNSVLLLNVPPNDRGLISEPDVNRLHEFRAALDKTFAVDLARGKQASADSVSSGSRASNAVDGKKGTHWSPAKTSGSLEINLGKPTAFNIAMLQEQISEGQRVEEYRIEALTDQGWAEVAKGTTIGHKKLDRFPIVTAMRVRLTILKSQAAPLIRTFGSFHAPSNQPSPAAS